MSSLVLPDHYTTRDNNAGRDNESFMIIHSNSTMFSMGLRAVDATYFLTHDNDFIQLSYTLADYHEMIFKSFRSFPITA